MKLKLRIFALMAMLLCFAFQANAQVAKIGQAEYSTFGEALNAAGEMSGDVTVEVYDKVTLNTAFSGSYSSINFVGEDTDAEIYLDVQGYITATGKKVSFTDLTLSKSQGGYITNAGFMNVAFGVYDVVEVVYTNCVFANGAYASSGNVTYTNCTFKKSWDKYGLWAYGDVDVTVDGCVFDNYRGIKMYAEGKAKTTELTVKNTDFSALGGDGSKPAIVLTCGASVVLEKNTYSSTGTLELDLDGDPNGTAVTSDVAPVCVNDNGACGVLVDGKIYATAAQAAEVATEGSNVTLLYSTTETVEFAEGVNLTLANGVIADNVTVIVAGLTGEGTAASPFLINNVDDLVWFQKKVDELAADGSTQFAGKYFKLTADINLAGINWNPIGSMSGDHGSFKGVFDGDNHTISNLNVEQNGNGIGLFARTAGNAVIKNLKLNNVTVKSTDNSNYVGGVVGNAYASTKIENVHLSGNIYISGRGYIGGIAGHGYVVMDNVSVVATGDGQGNDKGLVTSTFWCAGGILGYGGEGATNIMNANVENVVVTSAAGGLGAIVGMAEDNNGTQPISGSNLSASNVEIKTYTGAYGDSYANYALGYLYGGNPTSKLTGEIKVENVGITTSNGVTPSVNDAVASIDGTIYFSLASAVVAADGKTITLLRDVELTETLTIPADKTIALDLNGKTISQTKECTASYEMICNKGNLTIKGEGKISFKDTSAGDPTFGWGSYTLRNEGTLVVENSTIEHLGEQNSADSVNHMYCAIFQYCGSTTINGGTISTPTYRSVRLWKGDMTINGGTFDGQVWVQAVDNSSNLEINGGTFSPAGADGSSVFVGNSGYEVEFAVTGGTFNTKIGCSDAASLAGAITGGSFTAAAKDNTNSALIADGCTFGEPDENGLYGIVSVPVAKVGDVEYASLQAALNAAAAGTGNVTVTILKDVDLTGVTWTPVRVSEPGYPEVTVEGNDKTITGLTDMLFAGTWAGGSGLIIKNLTIANSTIVNDKDDSKGTVGVGAFIGFPQASATITLENCHLKDSRVEGGHWTGGLIGMAGGYNGTDGPVFMNLTIKGCSVTGSTITGKGSAGGVIGHGSCSAWTNVVIEETTVSGNTITSTGSSTNKAGAVMGTIGAAGQPTTVNGVTNTGGASVSATVAGNTVTSSGTPITTIYGRQGTATGMLYVAGGSYDNYPIEQGVAYAAPVEGYVIAKNADGTYGIQEAEVVVAKIGEVEYETLAAAVAAADAGETITLIADVELTETLTIPADKTIALDLNGKTISQTKEQTAGYQMILNDGNLTINDSSDSKAGKISYTDSGNGGEYISDVIYNRSVLVINGGTIENLSSATVASNGYPHAVDTYSGIRDTYVEINGGTIYCAEYSAIRMFCVSATNKADLVINDGTIKGAIDMQNGTKVAALGTLTINDGTFETTKNANNIRFANWNGGATEYGVSAEIKGGSFNGGITTTYVPAAANWNKGIISGGTYAQDMTDFCAEGFICEANADGTYGVVNDPGYFAEWTFDDSNSRDYTNGTKLTVGTLTFKRTFIADIWNPLYLPFDIELTAELLDKFEFYEYNQMLSTDTDGDRVPDDFAMELFVFQGGTLEANYPYFVRPKNAEACTMEVVMNDAKLYEADENSFETKSMKNIFTLSGTHKSMTADELAGKFVMSTEGKWQPAGSNMKSHRLYLSITDRNGNSIASKAIRMVVRGEDGFEGTTGVDIVETDNAADGTIYDLSGHPVVEPVKGGMYIINGKKVVY